MDNPLKALTDELVRVHDLAAIHELLDWDQQTFMPRAGAEARARQTALLAGLAHERFTSDRIGELLDACSNMDLSDDEWVVVDRVARDRKRALCLPTSLVEELARVTSEAHQVWVTARSAKRFDLFEEILGRVIDLKRQKATAVGWPDGGHPYDALLDGYEPGATVAFLDPLIREVSDESSKALQAVMGSSVSPRTDILRRGFSVEKQEAFCRRVLDAMGFDFEAGRLDESAHPFTTSFDPHDVRLTTRYHGDYLPAAIFGAIHEGGHGLYEQGLDLDHIGTPLSEPGSLGLHESQSRLWENQIGRSLPFWRFWYPVLQETFGDVLSDVSLEAFHLAVNGVRPSLIRVEADEVTYNLHIAVRYELEKALIAGDLAVGDLPEAWNERMESLVGVRPESDSDGVLQDVHWSMGLIGYFPTYLLGNLYAAQFAVAAREQITDFDDRIAAGDLMSLREWLRNQVHRQGRRYEAPQLVERVTGRPPSAESFSGYLKERFGPLYDVTW
ncbi:MAG: carboxypeptidase M32 [Deltaproteobacteria bacterium]|nr:carboxypeptidase M32 [Deltaproteobacteria bacterium]